MPEPTETPEYRAAVVDLLGVLGYAELTAFSRLAADSDLAPSQPLRARLAGLAVAEFHHYESIVAELTRRGADPEAAMAPFIEPIDQFHERTRPSTWLEGLVKAYVGDGLAADFYTEVASFVDPDTKRVVLASLQDVGQADFVVSVVSQAIAADPKVGGRLALWGRRLVGEALTQGQFVALQRDALVALVVGGVGHGSADLAEISRMFGRMTDRHQERMARLGLAS